MFKKISLLFVILFFILGAGTLLGKWTDIFHGFGTEIPQKTVHFWSDDGNFIYTGSELSTLSGSTDFFIGKLAIDSIKSLHSDFGSQSRFYIEYPNFAEISNLSTLGLIQKTINQLNNKNTSKNSGFVAYFSLSHSNNIGSIIYDIEKYTQSGTIAETHKKAFLVTNEGKIFEGKDFINLSNNQTVEPFIEKIITQFGSQFPESTPLEKESQKQNLVAYLQNPQFAFSGNLVNFYINSDILSSSENSPITLDFDYSEVKDIIKLAPKSLQKPSKKEAKQQYGSDDGKKYVALTFDDGPHGKYTPILLNTLKEKGVKATFFVLGKNAEHHGDILKQEIDEGHEIANHSFDHSSFTRLSKQAMREQVQKTDTIIKNAIGTAPQYFRPPYGAYNKQVIKTVNKPFILWSVDSRDWKNRNVQKNLKITLSTVHDGAIILYHDIHKESVETIPFLIDALRKQGYEFLTVSELYEKYHGGSLLPEQLCFSMNNCSVR